MKSKSVSIPQITTLDQAIEHQRKHGFARNVEQFVRGGQAAQKAVDELTGKPKRKPRGVRLPNKTEREFGFILEAQKTKGEIRRYEFEGIRLKWGVDEETGEAMWYKPDYFVVVNSFDKFGRCIEVKGAHIWEKDVIRFKGCRAVWQGEFDFQLWQKLEGQWNRLL